MASETAQMIIAMLRKSRAAAKDQGAIAVPVDYEKRRAFVEARHAQQPTAPGVAFETCEAGGIEMIACVPETLQGDDIVLYIHGGGFITGSARSSKAYASCLAAASGLKVYTLSYRLAPEDPYPAAPKDCFTVYQALLAKHPGKKIALAGGSAGGNLSLVTTLCAKEAALPLPAALILFSPATCLSGPLPSRFLNAEKDCMISGSTNDELSRVYCPDADLRDPHLSPLYGDLQGFPPMLITADKGEVLLDDSLLLDAYARAAGVQTELILSDDLFHDYPSMGPTLPEGKAIMDKAVALLRRCSM